MTQPPPNEGAVQSAPMDIQAFARIELVDSDGNRRRLGQYWEHTVTVVAFVRHFG